jgi:hypothetical protein
MSGGRHSLGPGRRVALRDFGYRTRKPRVDFAAYSAHLVLPTYFGRDEVSVPADSIAVVDLTLPGSPRQVDEVRHNFPAHAISHLATTSPRRSPTTLLLFAEPVRVPPLRLRAAAKRRRLTFRLRDSHRVPPARIDGVLLRADNPRWAADRFVAAGSMRGMYRDGGWYADRRGVSAARPGADPAWARAVVDRLDGLARVLAVLLVPLVVAGVALGDRWPAWGWAALAAALGAMLACWVIAANVYRRQPEPQLRPDKPSHRVISRGWTHVTYG